MGKPQGTPSVKSTLAGRRPYWTAEEDAQLVRLVKKYGTKNWGLIAKELHSPVQRKGKSCRSRWMHQLNPCIKHEPFSVEEERILIARQREFGNKWSKIAAYLPGRTDNAIKNHWHGHVKRRLSARALFSSDEEDVMEELKSEEPWMEDIFPVPLPRSRCPEMENGRAQQDIECAKTLLELSKSNEAQNSMPQDAKPIPMGLTIMENPFLVVDPSPVIKTEPLSEEENSESSKEPNNIYSHLLPEPVPSHALQQFMEERTHEENNNTAEMIQPDQQKILLETLESAGLAHYSILPLCPIKEEDINSEQHVVIVLQPSDVNSADVPMQDSCSEGASVCLLPEDRTFQTIACQSGGPSSFSFLDSYPVSEYTLYDPSPPFQGIHGLAMVSPHVNEHMVTALSSSPTRPRREIKKPVRFLEVGQKFE